jgi:hypothetical protein
MGNNTNGDSPEPRRVIIAYGSAGQHAPPASRHRPPDRRAGVVPGQLVGAPPRSADRPVHGPQILAGQRIAVIEGQRAGSASARRC